MAHFLQLGHAYSKKATPLNCAQWGAIFIQTTTPCVKIIMMIIMIVMMMIKKRKALNFDL